MTSAGAATPVHIVTGFLGAGKTTLLGHALRTEAFRHTALIVNEVDAIGLDNELLLDAVDSPPLLLKGGCVCCALDQSLAHTLRELELRRARGQVPHFARVVVETTGLADPRPIIAELVTDPWLAHHFEFANVISLFDAHRGVETLAAHVESVAQLGTADIVVLSKTDLLPPACRASLIETITGLNRDAVVLEADRGRLSAPSLLCQCQSARRPTDGHRSFFAEAAAPRSAPIHGSALHAATSAHLVTDHRLPWTRWAVALDRVAAEAHECLLRVKGLIAVSDVDQPIVVHAVGSTFFKPELLPRWPTEDRRSRVVMIRRGPGAHSLAERLESLLTAPAA